MIYIVYVACAYVIVQWIATTTTMVSIFLDRAQQQDISVKLLIIPVTIVFFIIAPVTSVTAGLRAKEALKEGLADISNAIIEALEEAE